MTLKGIQFKLVLHAEEDPALCALLAPLAPKLRGRRLRALLRAGLALENGAAPVRPPMVSELVSPTAAEPDILDELDPRAFRFTGESS